MLDTRTEETKLLDEIGDAIDEIVNPDDAICNRYFSWHYGSMTNEELKQHLLPICKLLNKLFFTHGPIDS